MPVVNYLKKVQLPNNTEYTVKDPTFFTGTTEEWNLLSIEEKQSYKIVNLTDDEEEGDISKKADKVTNAVDGNFAGLDSNGNLTDSGHKHSDYLTQHQDISSKADKVTSATNGNLAGLNGSGNLTDSTWSADKTTQSATGNPISISGLKSNQLAINPIITFEPIQAGSGTPSPSNVRAISGYDKVDVLSCGRNVLPFPYETDSKSQNDVTFTVNSDGSVSLSGTASADASLLLLTVRDDSLGGYKMTGGVSSGVYMRQRIVAKNGGAFIRDRADTGSGVILDNIDEETEMYYILAYVKSGVNTTGMKFYPMLQLASGASDTYEPYHKATSISESLGQTVYWGRWKPRTGEFEVLGGRVYLPDLLWEQYQSNLWISYSLNDVVSTAIYPKILHPDTNNDVVEAVCEKYQTDDVVTLMANQTTNIRIGANAVGTMFFATGNGSENTPTGYMAYKLLEPFTIQLTPHEISLLKDYAYVSTNGTNIALDYHNGELASLADVSQLGETVNELGDYVGRNSMGTYIDVKSYTESNPYKFVSDGYVYISSQGATSGTIEVFVMGSNGVIAARIRHQIHAPYEDENLFVKRGMYLYVSSCPPQCFAQFRPIV